MPPPSNYKTMTSYAALVQIKFSPLARRKNARIIITPHRFAELQRKLLWVMPCFVLGVFTIRFKPLIEVKSPSATYD